MFMRHRAKELIDGKYRRSWIAEQCGITNVYLNQLLQGAQNPGRPLVKLMANVLSVPESELFTLETQNPPGKGEKSA